MDPLWTLAVVLLVLWAIGYGMAYTLGGLLHVLLLLVVVLVIVRLLQGRPL